MLAAESPLRILVGKEVEVPAEHLVHLLPYFDLSPVAHSIQFDRGVPAWYMKDRESGPSTQVETQAKWDLLIANYLIGRNHFAPLRKDCPRSVREVLERMNWSRDNGRMEFRDTHPFLSEREFNQHTHRFLSLVKMEEIQNNPLLHLGRTYFHIHLSLVTDRDLTPIAHLLNMLSLMRFVEAGRGELALTDQYGFFSRLTARGLFRMIHQSHVELRNHFFSPEEDLAYLIRIFSLPEEDSVRELSIEIQRRLTPDAIKVITQFNPLALVEVALSIENPSNEDFIESLFTETLDQALQVQFRSKRFGVLVNFFDNVESRYPHLPRALDMRKKLLRSLQDLVVEKPSQVVWSFPVGFPALYRLLQDHLPPHEIRIDLNAEPWPEVLLESIALGDKHSPYSPSIRDVVELLLAESELGRRRVKRLLNKPISHERMLFQLRPKSLVDPLFLDSALQVVRKLSDLRYLDFLQSLESDVSPQLVKESELIPYLYRALEGSEKRQRNAARRILKKLGEPSLMTRWLGRCGKAVATFRKAFSVSPSR